jgi:hypothetical protein
MQTQKIELETKPHNLIPKACTHIWTPLGNGLWKRTTKTFPGLPKCTVEHK